MPFSFFFCFRQPFGNSYPSIAVLKRLFFPTSYCTCPSRVGSWLSRHRSSKVSIRYVGCALAPTGRVVKLSDDLVHDALVLFCVAAFFEALDHLLGHGFRRGLANLAVDAQAGGDHAAEVADVARHHDGGALAGQLAERVDVLLGDGQADGALGGAAARLDRVGDGVDAGGRGLGLHEDGLGLTGGAVDLLGLQSLRGQDDALLLALGDVDGALALALGVEDLGALAALGRDLAVHGLDDGGGRVDVADLVPQARHAPGLRGLVDGRRDVGVERRALLEDVVERQLADLGTHRRLGELGYGVFGIFDSVAVRGEPRVSICATFWVYRCVHRF